MLVAVVLSGYAIFDRARTVWSSQQYPSVVDYVVDVTATDADGQPEHRHYHEFWKADADAVVVQPPVSDEQLAAPYKPSGWFAFEGYDLGGPGTGVKGDIFDVPALAPNYSFGIAAYTPPSGRTPADLVREIRREYHDPSPAKVSNLERQSGFKTIAQVVSSRQDYAITFDGTQQIAGHEDYHLSLRPLADPKKYRLREMWVNEQTYTVDRLRLGANFNDAALEAVSWTVNLRQFGGATYIANETAQAPLDGYHGRMYDTFSVSFEDLGTGQMPFWTGGSSGGGSLSEP
jgi:hypothetical protein